MLRNAGQAPAIYDQAKAESTLRNIRNYLNNKGYFNSKVSYQTKIRKKKIEVTYTVVPATPYRINNVNVRAEDSIVGDMAKEILLTSPLKNGNIYDFSLLEAERERLNREIRNKGYYFFSNDYVFYEIDSSLNSHLLDIYIVIKNPRRFLGVKDEQEQFENDRHKKYYIDDIVVYPQYAVLNDSVAYDTLVVTKNYDKDSVQQDFYQFLIQSKLRIHPKTILRSVFLKRNQTFNATDVNNTYKSLTDLSLYRYVNIDFVPDSQYVSPTTGKLDCIVQLSRGPVQAYTIESEVTNTGGYPGVSGSLIYENRNLFRGAETFRVKLRAALEMQTSFDEIDETKFLFFNTVETGIDVSLTFPRYVGPIGSDLFPGYLRPKTVLSGGFGSQIRPDYKRYVSNISFGYKLKVNDRKTHFLNPIEVNVVQIFPSTSFDSIINTMKDQAIKAQYSNHVIMGLSYSYIYTDQEIGKQKNFRFLRFNLESSGNMLRLAQTILQAPKGTDGSYTLFNIRYAQYLKTSIDFRYFYNIYKDNSLAFRAFIGIGKAYANSEYLPFEKGFFAGGANGMRGWVLKLMGPGAYRNSLDNNYDRMGDLQLETNFEYRFPIYSVVKGALFADVGNIWLLKANALYPEGVFQTDTFIEELGFDAGFGMRLDFTYFVFRLDAALRMYDPGEEDLNRWVIKKASLGSVVWNFGIGYPF